MPVIRNISDKNIIIQNKILDPNKSLTISQDQLDEIAHLVDNHMIKIEVQTVKRSEVKKLSTEKNENKQFLDLKERLIPAFFALHLNQNLNEQQIDDLKWFFKNVGPTSELDYELKSLLDDIESEEELLEILLNHLYPELIKNYFKKYDTSTK